MLGIMAALSLTASTLYATVPVVTNVVAVQRAGVKVIDIHYDAFDADGDLLKVRVEVSHSAGATYSVPAFSLSGDIGQRIAPGAGKHIVWNAGIDWDGEYSDIMRIKVIVSDGKGLPGLAWGYEVPPGGFMMGQDGGVEGIGPARHVNIPWSYWLSKYEITIQQYVDYLNMALITGEVYRDGTSSIKANGGIYTGLSAGALLINLGTSRDIVWNVNNLDVNSNRTNFPVNVTWYGAVAFAQHYGYDLPTEAEWEKAARGPDHDGLEEHQIYPWGNTLDGGKANYYNSGDPYQGGSVYRGCSPVGYYNGNQVPFGTNMVNAYGLYDMSGNVSEWCRSTVASTVESYPQLESLTNALHKLDTTAKRLLRGGGWGASYVDIWAVNPPTGSLQCYYRVSSEQNTDYPNVDSQSGGRAIRDVGFRVVRRGLSIEPSEATLPSLNNTQVFTAVGGVPSYAWSVSNSKGSVNPATGNSTTYTRLLAGTNYVTCTDAAGLTATARIIQP
jgi:formylglycine-generating enzyme required for sulfatase activity